MVKSSDKFIDKSIYNEKSLYRLNIRELRGLGNKLHIPAPTMMNKKELVDYILKVVYGEVEIPTRSNFGRPKTRELDIDQFINKLKKNSDNAEDLLNITSESYDSYFGIGALKLASPKSSELGDNIEIRTYFEEDNKCYLRVREFVASERDIEISKEYAKKLELENLDVLDVRIEGDMFKIIAVNGVSVKDKFKDLTINNKEMKVGNRQVFSIRTKEKREEIINEISLKCENAGLKLIIFASKKYTDKCTDYVEYDSSEGYPKMYKNFMKMISLCEKEIYNGEDVVVLLENAPDVEDMFEAFEDDANERAKNNINQLLNKILKLGNIIISFRFEKTINF